MVFENGAFGITGKFYEPVGVMAYQQSLPVNSVLIDEFRILGLLGSGGFANTYLALDLTLGREVAVKEFFPSDLAIRANTQSVSVKSAAQENQFQWALGRFVREAKTLAKFRHPSVVRVFRVFNANDTAYIVLEFVRGANMDAWLKRLQRPPTQQELDVLIPPLLDALEVVHAAGILHRDCKPANIYIREADETPVLLDFGAAKYAAHALADQAGTTAAIVSKGYSPNEAYSADGRMQGPWTDIYGLSATLYRSLTGSAPQESTSRILQDDCSLLAELPNLATQYRPEFLAGIDWGLALMPRDRPQSIGDWREQLFPELAASASARREREALGAPAQGVPDTWQPASDSPTDAATVYDSNLSPGGARSKPKASWPASGSVGAPGLRSPSYSVPEWVPNAEQATPQSAARSAAGQVSATPQASDAHTATATVASPANTGPANSGLPTSGPPNSAPPTYAPAQKPEKIPSSMYLGIALVAASAIGLVSQWLSSDEHPSGTGGGNGKVVVAPPAPAPDKTAAEKSAQEQARLAEEEKARVEQAALEARLAEDARAKAAQEQAAAQRAIDELEREVRAREAEAKESIRLVEEAKAKARAEEEVRLAATKAEEERKAKLAREAEDARRVAEAKARAEEEVRLAAARKAEEERKAKLAREAEDARRVEEARLKAEEERRLRAAREADEERARQAALAAASPTTTTEARTEVAALTASTTTTPQSATAVPATSVAEAERKEDLVKVQAALKKNKCFEGETTGDLDATTQALSKFQGMYTGTSKPLQLASATRSDVVEWVSWFESLSNVSCAPKAPVEDAEPPRVRKPVYTPPPKPKYTPPPKPKYTPPPQKAAPQRAAPKSSGGGGGGADGMLRGSR